MKNTLMILLCAGGILAAGCSKSRMPTVLHGTWSGQEVGAKAEGSPSLTFNGMTMEFHGANPQDWYKATYRLNEDTTPKRLDAVITESGTRLNAGKTTHAIYKIEGGMLTLTGYEPGNPAVPASFDAPGARQMVFTLKQ